MRARSRESVTYSPSLQGRRFSVPPAGTPASPRRACPAQGMVVAEFSSRSMTSPQFGQVWVRRVRTERLLRTRLPQPEQS
jgi:hypothetical protein